jgi:hypothetical protein
MAIRYAVANGNWSNPATWDGGTLPGNGDDVYTDGKTVTIDIDLVGIYRPARLLARNRGGGTNGGQFVVNTTRQIGESGNSVEIVGADAVIEACKFTGPSGTVLTIYGNIQGGTSAQAWGVHNSSSGSIVIHGNIVAGSGNTAMGAYNSSSGSITVNGNILGGSGTSAYGVQNVSGTIIITGNVTGGSNSSANGVNNSSTGIITISGNVTGGSNSSAYGISNSSTGTVVINGNVQPTATGQAAVAVYNNSTGYITINGDVYGGRGAAAVYANNGYIRINGALKWDATYSNSPAVDSSNNGVIVLNGDVLHHYGTTGLYGMTLAHGRITMLNGSNYLTTYAESDGNGPGVTGNPVYHDGAARAASNFPTPANVRYGTIYGPANEYTGTCHVPPKEAVAAGTPVDNTVGIAVLTQNDIIQAVWHGENIEADGFTPFKALRVIAAACGGKISGSGTSQVVIKAANDSNTTRITADVDSQGNRLNVTFNV